MRCELRVTSGTHQGRRMWLRDGQTIQVGRTEYADLCIADDPLMSRVHFALDSDGGMVRLRDLGSRNGTYVNGQLVKLQELRHGDSIVAGQTRFDVLVEQAEGTAVRSDEGGSSVHPPAGIGTNAGAIPVGQPPYPNPPASPGYSGPPNAPGPQAPQMPPQAMPPYGSPGPSVGDPTAAPTQYHPPPQTPQGPGSSGMGSFSPGVPPGSPTSAPEFGANQPVPGAQAPHQPPNAPIAYPPGAGSGPGQSPPQMPGSSSVHATPPPYPVPPASGTSESVSGGIPPGQPQQNPSGANYPPQFTGPPPGAGIPPNVGPSGADPNGVNPSHAQPPGPQTPADPFAARHPGQSLYGAQETPPEEMGSGTYQLPPSTPQSIGQESTSQNPITEGATSSWDAQSPIQSSTPFESSPDVAESHEAHHRTPFDESQSDPSGDEARQDPEAQHSSPFDSSVAAAMQTLAGEFGNMDPAKHPHQADDSPITGDMPPKTTNASISEGSHSHHASSMQPFSSGSEGEANAPGNNASINGPAQPSAESGAGTSPDSQSSKSTGWSITADDLPNPPKSPKDSTADLVPKTVPSEKLPTQTIGNEIADTDQEPSAYGTAVFDSSLEDSTLAYATFSSVYANVAYRESTSNAGLRCFVSHGEKSSAADIAKSLGERNQTYALVNISRLEESSRRLIDSNPNRSTFAQVIDDVVLISKADPLDFIGLLRSNWGRDALILLTANLQKQKVLQDLRSRSHFFHHPSALVAELENLDSRNAQQIFGGLEAILLEGPEQKSWTIYLNPAFEGDWMRLGMPCPPVNDAG